MTCTSFSRELSTSIEVDTFIAHGGQRINRQGDVHGTYFRGAVLALTLAAATSALSEPSAAGADAMQALNERYDHAMQTGSYDEAANAAAGYISTLLNQSDYDRRDWADGLVRLGHAQRSGTDFDSAIQNYEQAIRILQTETDRLDISLVEPMLGASEAMIGQERYADASGMLEDVLHLQQVNQGLHDLSQAEPLQLLSDVYLALGDVDRALARQRAHSGLYDRNFPGDDVRKLNAFLAEAGLLDNLGMRVDSHTVYRRTINMVERAEGHRAPELVPALMLIAELLASHQIMDGYDGRDLWRRYLQKAVWIADTSESLTTIERADAYIAAGDLMSKHTVDRDGAHRHYGDGWQVLAADPALESALRERFEEPLLLQEMPRSTAPDMRNLFLRASTRETSPGSRIVVRFDVNEDGDAENIEVIEGDPTGYWSELVVDHVEKFVFRPRMVDGETVRHEDMYWDISYIVDGEDLIG